MLAPVTDGDTEMTPTAEAALDLLRQLAPEEQLRVIARALPEATAMVVGNASNHPSGENGQTHASGDERLRRLEDAFAPLRAMNIRISAEEIDAARREMWGNFPRDESM